MAAAAAVNQRKIHEIKDSQNIKWKIGFQDEKLLQGEKMALGCPMCGSYGFGGMWFLWPALWLLVIAALALFIIWLLKQIQKKEGNKETKNEMNRKEISKISKQNKHKHK